MKNLTLVLMLLLTLFVAPRAARADITDNPLHNYSNRLDVDNNGVIQPRDCLLVINHIQQPTAQSFAFSAQSDLSKFFVDTNDDSLVSPIDALLVINSLSQTPEPSTMILGALGASLLVGAAWRQRRLRRRN